LRAEASETQESVAPQGGSKRLDRESLMDIKDLGKVHVAIPKLAEDLRDGRLDRREFLRTSVLLGLAIPTAYSVASVLTGEPIMPQALA